MSTVDELLAVIRMYAKNPTRHNEFKVRATLTDFLPFADQEPNEPFASGSLPPLPEPCNKGQTLNPDYGQPWTPLFNRSQMYEYARQSLYLVDQELLGFAQWLLDAYHSDEGMPEAKEIAKEARSAIALAKPEGA